MHRCVIFEGSENLPLPFSAVDSRRPEDLWSYMERQRMRGVDGLAIPHNPNLSDGMMFALVDSYGQPLNENYAARRTWNEPVVEVTQTKGTSETHPMLSPNDDFARFELFTQLLGTSTQGETSGSYVREAFLNGVRLQAESGFSPFMFGLVGGTDNHQATSQIQEDDYGGSGENYYTAKLRHERVYAGGKGLPYQAFSAAGLTAVWAGANTREEIFASLRRRETYATSGPRITVRFFGSFSYTADVLEQIDWIERAYRHGTSMGGVIGGRDAEAEPGEGSAPKFIVRAANCPPPQLQ